MTTQHKFGVFICYGKQMVLYSCKMPYHARLMYSSQTLWLSSNVTKRHCATEHHSHAMPIEMFDMNISTSWELNLSLSTICLKVLMIQWEEVRAGLMVWGKFYLVIFLWYLKCSYVCYSIRDTLDERAFTCFDEKCHNITLTFSSCKFCLVS